MVRHEFKANPSVRYRNTACAFTIQGEECGYGAGAEVHNLKPPYVDVPAATGPYIEPSELQPGDKFRFEDTTTHAVMTFMSGDDVSGIVTRDHGEWFLQGNSRTVRRIVLVERAPEPTYEPGDLVRDDRDNVYERIHPWQDRNGGAVRVWRVPGGPVIQRFKDEDLRRPLRRLKVVDDA